MTIKVDHYEVKKKFNLLQCANGIELVKTLILIQGGAFVALASFLAATLASGNKQSLIAVYPIFPALKSFGTGASWSIFALMAETTAREITDSELGQLQIYPEHSLRYYIKTVSDLCRAASAAFFLYCISWCLAGVREAGDAYSAIATALETAINTGP